MNNCFPIKLEKADITLFIEMQCIFHTCIINRTVAQSMLLSGRFCFHDRKNFYLDPVCLLIVRAKLLRRAGTFLSRRRYEVSHFHGRAGSYRRFHYLFLDLRIECILMFMEYSRDPCWRNASYFWSNIRSSNRIVRSCTWACKVSL